MLSPYINRFIQPDSIVPGPSVPQSWNKYSYGLNNPSRYTDPTGHVAVADTNEAGCSGKGPSCIIKMYSAYGDDDGMMDSLRHYSRRNKEYNPVSDIELSDEEKALVSIAMFQADIEDTPEGASLSDVMKNAFSSAALVGFFGLITEGMNPAPDDSGGGGGNYLSTGRTTPRNLTEKLAMEAVVSNPNAGVVLPITMKDPRWPASEGWVKMAQNINGVEIHYVHNTQTGVFADFKFP